MKTSYYEEKPWVSRLRNGLLRNMTRVRDLEVTVFHLVFHCMLPRTHHGRAFALCVEGRGSNSPTVQIPDIKTGICGFGFDTLHP